MKFSVLCGASLFAASAAMAAAVRRSRHDGDRAPDRDQRDPGTRRKKCSGVAVPRHRPLGLLGRRSRDAADGPDVLGGVPGDARRDDGHGRPRSPRRPGGCRHGFRPRKRPRSDGSPQSLHRREPADPVHAHRGNGGHGESRGGRGCHLPSASGESAKAPPRPSRRPTSIPARTTLEPKKIEAILGTAGDFKDGVLKVVVAKPARMHGVAVGAAMGVNTWAAFAGSDGTAVVDGDFAMLESELQGVLKALRRAGIEIVAIHSHMTGEDPRILFLHYWGIGPAETLAKGLQVGPRHPGALIGSPQLPGAISKRDPPRRLAATVSCPRCS